jgi:hypothetical protein
MKIEQDENLVEAEADGLAKAYEKIMGYAGVLDDDE